MKSKNKIIFLILTLLILYLPFTACNSSDDTADVNDDENSVGGENLPDDADASLSDAEQRLLIPDDLPEADFSGADFPILYPEWSNYILGLYFAEDESSDPLNGAVYARQRTVEERFNVRIKPVMRAWDQIYNELSKTVKAGTDEYSLALTHVINGVYSMLSSGIAVNWNTVPHVDFNKPWWNHRMNDELSVYGILCTAVSDFMIFDPNVIYFNKQMIADYNLENPYGIVKDYKWTWDKLEEMAKLASKDLNGDGIFDESDQYGFVTLTSWMMDSAIHAYGLSITKRDEDGYAQVNLDNPVFYELTDKLNRLMFTGNQTFVGYWDPNAPVDNESAVPMSSGRCLFHVDPLSAAMRYRSYEVDFGILPFPKSDYADEYLSLSWNGFMIIPQTANLEKVGMVSEALAAESYRHVIPEYYSVLLTSKLTRDEESMEMLDIIFKGATYDFALNLGNWTTLSMPLTNMQSAKITDVASYVEKNRGQLEKQIANIYEAVEKNYLNQ